MVSKSGDNDASLGTKGDFIFRDYDEDGNEYISIMFEMKNEADATATKHRNDDFLDKLHKDRTEKHCEYAVLVSMLERDNELYNAGIVNKSYLHDKMFVIRPQMFMIIISLFLTLTMGHPNQKLDGSSGCSSLCSEVMSIIRVAVVPSGSSTVTVEMVLAMSSALSTLSAIPRVRSRRSSSL